MKNKILIITGFFILSSFFSCKKEVVEKYNGRVCGLTVTDIHPKAANYQKIIDKLISLGDVGTSVTIISPEGTWSKTAGMSDLKNQTPVVPCDLFRIGSISKTYTAVTIMKLYEQGSFDLDDKIASYIPDRIISKIANGNIITIKQLLNHTSGVKNYSDMGSYYSKIANGSIRNLSAEDCLSFIYNKKANFSPGTKYAYSNSNYLLLGIIIKIITHKNSAYEAINDLLIVPNGYLNTFLTPNPTVVKGYLTNDNGAMKDFSNLDFDVLDGIDRTDGGITANSYDVASFIHDLMNGNILDSSSLELMQNFSGEDNYGLGLYSLNLGNKTGIGHDGETICFVSVVFYFKDINTTICILNNCISDNVQKAILEKEIYSYLY
jgi:D-alanyl-D-alanine carboxypeptidase